MISFYEPSSSLNSYKYFANSKLNNLYPFFHVQVVLDPTFLLNGKEWVELTNGHQLPIKKKYVLVYGLYRNDELHKYAAKLAKQNNLIIVNVCDMLDYKKKEKNVFKVTPFNLIQLINNAEHVVTDSFHGCALSINLNKQLHIFYPKTSKARIDSLCQLFDIGDRIVDKNLNILEDNINYSKLNDKMAELRKDSINYLKRAVNDR